MSPGVPQEKKQRKALQENKITGQFLSNIDANLNKIPANANQEYIMAKVGYNIKL